MRAFIAIELPSYIKDKISQLIEDLKPCQLDCKWVQADNLHMTLKFLGDIQEGKVQPILEAIAKTAKKFKAFDVYLKDAGFFPNQRRPKVLFFSTTEEELLKNMAFELEEGLKALGFPVEAKFKAHITLARIKSAKNLDKLIEKLEGIRISDIFTVKDIVLKKSTLTPKGPVYQTIGKINLTA
ncbi:MAG: RNA 2',3'-cyclic phosphodiesterase [Candidatus Omnitrophica bacterium]|nr:RNA 2',3'-cyclic phosphodiesterase [Candidatus Omnitrophota bacterium]